MNHNISLGSLHQYFILFVLNYPELGTLTFNFSVKVSSCVTVFNICRLMTGLDWTILDYVEGLKGFDRGSLGVIYKLDFVHPVT